MPDSTRRAVHSSVVPCVAKLLGRGGVYSGSETLPSDEIEIEIEIGDLSYLISYLISLSSDEPGPGSDASWTWLIYETADASARIRWPQSALKYECEGSVPAPDIRSGQGCSPTGTD